MMDSLVTGRREGDDLILRLGPVARASLVEMLEMLDLDAFSMAPEDRQVLEDAKHEIMTAAER